MNYLFLKNSVFEEFLNASEEVCVVATTPYIEEQHTIPVVSKVIYNKRGIPEKNDIDPKDILDCLPENTKLLFVYHEHPETAEREPSDDLDLPFWDELRKEVPETYFGIGIKENGFKKIRFFERAGPTGKPVSELTNSDFQKGKGYVEVPYSLISEKTNIRDIISMTKRNSKRVKLGVPVLPYDWIIG